MSENRRTLIGFQSDDDKPSIRKAKKFIKELLSEGLQEDEATKSILDGYADDGYSPNIAEIIEWAEAETAVMREDLQEELDSVNRIIATEIEQIGDTVFSYSKGDLSEDVAVAEVARLFEWMNNSVYSQGVPHDRYWQAAKIISAHYQMSKLRVTVIDCLYDLQLEWIKAIEANADYILAKYSKAQNSETPLPNDQNEARKNPSQPNLKLAADSDNGEIESPPDPPPDPDERTIEISEALDSVEKLIELASKIGFMYRDAWWLEQHGDAALKGYLARETAKKAGEGGTKASSSARRNRIFKFLDAHAELIRENPILRDDPSGDVALRALKLAKSKFPDDFRNASSKKAALDYWLYIKSDKELLSVYAEKLKPINPLRN